MNTEEKTKIELTRTEEKGGQKESQNSVGQVLSVIERAASNPDVDVTKMQALLDMQLKVMDKQAEIEFNDAMARMQQDIPVIRKNGKIEFTDKNGQIQSHPFAKYEDIDRAIRPLLLREGFSLAFTTDWSEAGAQVTGILRHKSGHTQEAKTRLPLDTSGSKNNLQAMGSTISYAQRYLVKMLLNIVAEGEDDDGVRFDTISLTDAAEIDQLVKETKADKAKFLKFMGVSDVRDIRTTDLKKARNALNTKKANANS